MLHLHDVARLDTIFAACSALKTGLMKLKYAAFQTLIFALQEEFEEKLNAILLVLPGLAEKMGKVEHT